jgi:hypothetical protein
VNDAMVILYFGRRGYPPSLFEPSCRSGRVRSPPEATADFRHGLRRKPSFDHIPLDGLGMETATFMKAV